MNQFSNKTTPWAGSNTSPNLVKQGNSIQSSIINQGLGNINTTGMIQFQQQQPQQCFQNSIGLGQQNISLGLQQIANNAINTANLNSQIASNPLFQVPTVSYPNPRGLNPTAFQTQSISSVPLAQISGTKQRFFTGTVTKVHDNFGFVDEDVFFQTNNCVKGSNPLIGDRVLVEATYNPSMPFKWNATRIQVLPATNQTKEQFNSKNYSNNYKSVPPPIERLGQNIRLKGNICGKGRDLSIERDDEIERKRRRQERVMDWVREEKKSPICRSRSPKLKRRSRIVPRYMVLIPKIALDVSQANVLEIRRRYSNMYIPSDFFISNFRWVDAFPPDQPFTLNKPCLFHIMREIEPIADKDAIIEPPDADYIFSAKVMLMSVPGMEELLKKCCATAEEKDNEEKDFVHPTRLISFLVGLRGKNETMAIGGPWSRSVDGDNPSKDPSVLIKTAIRTCKALTGIDLSSCTQWYRFVELYYRRAESTHKGNYVAARVETVVLFLPDVWSCLPTRLEWDELQLSYKRKLELKLKLDIMAESDDTTAAADEKEEENTTDKCEPTHYSLLDPKSMGIGNLKNELKARNMNYKGLKSQLVARLTKVLKGEMEKTVDEPNTLKESQAIESLMEETKYKGGGRNKDEKEITSLEKRYALPEEPHIIVHPSPTAKSGKFDCTTMSLSLLLDYRPEDTKEHSFEVSLFAELFNEMLIRDFGFNIFKALYNLPENLKDKVYQKRKYDRKQQKDEEKKKHTTEEDAIKEEKTKLDSMAKENKDTINNESEEDYNEGCDKQNRERHKKEKVKLVTKYKQLLLSFVYFDQTHCGYIFDKDIEDLLYILGLNLSRAQVRKLVGKVITRDSLHYRKLTDKPFDEEIITTNKSVKEFNIDLALGNKKLLPIFQEEKNLSNVTKNNGMILFGGALMDVGKLQLQLERSEQARIEIESKMVELKKENLKLFEKNHKLNSNIKNLDSELNRYKEKLKHTENIFSKVSTSSKIYQNIILDIKEKIEPIINTINKEEKEQNQEESKTRWI